MEFLRSIFHGELDEEGEILIAGETFTRHAILNGLAPGPYAVAFNEWLRDRRIRLLERADEILRRYDNGRRFERLKTAFEADKVVPFVGAGMSVATGYPAWTKFLYQLCGESHIPTTELDVRLARGEYEEAAQLIHDDLGPALFNENLETAFSGQRRAVGPINYLPALFPRASIITTNFDTVIESIYEGTNDSDAGFDLIQSGHSLGEVLRQTAGGSRLLIKLHGDCRQVGDRVLLKSEYDAAYSNAGVVKQFFNRVVFGQSLLFVGCSLTADRTIKTMKHMVSDCGAHVLPRHYAFLELRRGDDRVARKKHLSEANIFPIWYDEGDHDESIEALFLKLLED